VYCRKWLRKIKGSCTFGGSHLEGEAVPRRALRFVPGEFYHIYNRGNEARPIFWEPDNYRYFLERMAKYLLADPIDLVAFCLMPNHFHLLLRLAEVFDVSDAMKKLGISYAKALNIRYGRIGHLFQGRFRSKHVADIEYVLQASLYIHRNPYVAHLVTRPEDWTYSSCSAYLSDSTNGLPEVARTAGIVLKKEILLDAVGGREKYEEYLRDEKPVHSLYTLSTKGT